MSSAPIVEHLEVIEDIGPSKLAGFVHPFFDPLLFQTAEKRFGDRIDAPMSSGRVECLEIGDD